MKSFFWIRTVNPEFCIPNGQFCQWMLFQAIGVLQLYPNHPMNIVLQIWHCVNRVKLHFRL